jgi:hypothetical protein
MRLRDLHAEFLGGWHDDRAKGGHIGYRGQGNRLARAQGIRFQCPLCAAGKPIVEEKGERFVRGAHSVICWFRNPRNAKPVPDDADPKPGRWWVSAASTGLDDLTFEAGDPPMSYSVLLTSGCGWHGFVKNGEAA